MKQQIHFITGKGGVGKSAYAAALALRLVKSQAKVLLVELGENSFYQDYLNLPEVGFEPVKTSWGFDIAQWSGRECLLEYAQHLIKVEALVKLFFENKVMKAFVDVAPGLQELAIMGKATSTPRKHGPPLVYDYIIVDCFATGHFRALMEAPRGMAKAVSIGPMGEQSRSIESTLQDPKRCHYHIVTLAEDLPMKESLELREWLLNNFGISGNLVINKQLIFPFSHETLASVQGEDAKLFAEYLLTQQEAQQAVVRKFLNDRMTFREIPHFYEGKGVDVIQKMAESIQLD